jgi:branched-chain amino acid transport system permease protein
MTFIGGVGTVAGPILGAVLYILLKEQLAVRWVDFHLLIFGALFMAIVLLLPGGLLQASQRARRAFTRWRTLAAKKEPGRAAGVTRSPS